MQSLPHTAPGDQAAICAGVHEQGLALVPGLLSPQTSAEVCRWIDALVMEPGDDDGDSDSTEYYNNLFNRDAKWLSLIDPPGMIEAVEQLLGEQCHLIGMTAWRTTPGMGEEPRQPDGSHQLHADQLFFPVDEELLVTGRVHLSVLLMTLHYYLVDVDEDLAPTWVVPGSHLSGCAPAGKRPAPGFPGTMSGSVADWRGQAPLPVVCTAGTGMLFRCELWHSGGHNATPDRSRYLLQVHYGTRAIAPRLPPHLEFRLDPRIVAAANPRQRRLLGGHQVTAYG